VGFPKTGSGVKVKDWKGGGFRDANRKKKGKRAVSRKGGKEKRGRKNKVVGEGWLGDRRKAVGKRDREAGCVCNILTGAKGKKKCYGEKKDKMGSTGANPC